MIIYVENSKKTAKKLLGLSEFSMAIGYKFNMPKSIVLLYIDQSIIENKI